MSVGKSGSEGSSSSGVWGTQQPYLQQLYQQASEMLQSQGRESAGFAGPAKGAWEQMINPQGNPYLEGMGQAGLDQLNKNFNENILPGIQGNAMGGMNLGSSRQGVAQGLAAGETQRAGSDFLTNLYGNQYQGDQNRALAALLNTGQVQNLPWQGLQNFAGLIGPPTKTGQSSNESKGLSIGL